MDAHLLKCAMCDYTTLKKDLFRKHKKCHTDER